jgi:hypothetical protein
LGEKFGEEMRCETAGSSTPFIAKNAPSFAPHEQNCWARQGINKISK